MRRPKIKDTHNPIRFADGRIRIGGAHFGVAAEISDEHGVTWGLLGLMDGTRGQDEIVAELVADRPELDTDSVREAVDAIVAAGYVEDAAAEPPAGIDPEDVERYARGMNYYSWIDLEPRSTPWDVQRALKGARVTVLGLGGAGSAVAASLVASGVGHVHCVDADVVERSNLNRQLLYVEDDIGSSKVATAVARLRALNSSVEVTGEEAWIETEDDLVALMRDRDLFMLCADRPDPRSLLLWTSDAAARTRTPWISCFYNGPMVVTGTFVPFEVPCYRCLRHWAETEGRDADAGETLLDTYTNAVTAPTAGLTGNFAAYEAINFLGGLRPQTIGRLYHFNLVAFDHFYFVEPPFWADCPTCGERARGAMPAGAAEA
jgi:molybdopterin/thiamine biosynthesis adenylyltransferase